MNQDARDPVDVFVRRVDEMLREVAQAPSARHLRLAGVELLRAVRCGLDGAIHALDPSPNEPEGPAKPDQPPTP
jgi:hypothetical protein